mgnify:CR=1 FL=1
MKAESTGTQVNDTMRKFGYPDSTVKEFPELDHLVASPATHARITGSVRKEPATAFSTVSPEAFAELRQVTAGGTGSQGAFYVR